MRCVLLFPLVALSLALTGCQPSATPSTPTDTPTPSGPTATPVPMAALVNGEGLPVAELEAEVDRYIQAQAGLGRTVSIEQATPVVLDDLIDLMLLAQAARSNGFTLEDADLQARLEALAAQLGGSQALADWQAAHGYSSETFQVALRRSVEAAWMRDRILAAVPSRTEQVHVRQILLYNEITAENVLAQLEAGADFGEQAARYDPVTGGELGWLPRGYLLDPQVEAAVFALQPGEHTQVITTPAGYHILQVLERDPQRPLSPDAALTLQAQALQDWLHQQREQGTIQLAP